MKPLKKTIKRIKNSTYSVAEVAGTIVLLGIAVSLFSMLYLNILVLPPVSSTPEVTLVGTIEGSNIIVEHRGGDSLSMDTNILITKGGVQSSTTAKKNVTDENGDGLWNVGERLVFPFQYNLSHQEAEIMAIDVESNSIVMMGTLDISPECDIGIRYWVDNKYPKRDEYVNLTVEAIHFRGDINATDIKVRIIFPHGFTHVSNTTSQGNYINSTGIWDIGTIAVGDSTILTIKAIVTLIGSTTPSQLAMILDGSGSISDASWKIMRNGLAAAIEDPYVFPHDDSVEFTLIQFGGRWNYLWDEHDSNWRQDDIKHSGSYSAYSEASFWPSASDFICDELDASGTGEIYVDFWYRLDNTDEDSDVELYFYNGSSYNYVTSLGGGTWGDWHNYQATINDPQYFVSNFSIGLYSDLEWHGPWWNRSYERVWLDDVLITKNGITLLEDGFETIPHAKVEYGPIIVDDTNYLTLSNDIRKINQLKSFTPLACGIYLAADILSGDPNGNLAGTPWEGQASPDFDPAKRQIINLVTDGMPNCECNQGEYTGSDCSDSAEGYYWGKKYAETARDYLTATLLMNETEGDEFDAEAVEIEKPADRQWLKDNISWPQPGTYVPPFSSPGWVRNVSTWEEFAETIDEKFLILFGGITLTAEVWNSTPWDPNEENNQVSIVIKPQPE
jgi:hypothetical protein